MGERRVPSQKDRRDVYIALRRTQPQAVALRKAGIGRTTAHRIDIELGLNSRHGPKTSRRPTPDPKIYTDAEAILHADIPPVPGAGDPDRRPGAVLQPQPPASPRDYDTESRDRALAIPADLLEYDEIEGLVQPEPPGRPMSEDLLLAELTPVASDREQGEAEILVTFDSPAGTWIKRLSEPSVGYEPAPGSYRAGRSLDLNEMGVPLDGLPARPEQYAPQRNEPLAAARARRAELRDRFRRQP